MLRRLSTRNFLSSPILTGRWARKLQLASNSLNWLIRPNSSGKLTRRLLETSNTSKGNKHISRGRVVRWFRLKCIFINSIFMHITEILIIFQDKIIFLNNYTIFSVINFFNFPTHHRSTISKPTIFH